MTKDEFTTAMSSYTCCGSNAPFSCYCDSWAYRIFPPVDSQFYDRFDVTFDTFASYVVAQNLSWAVERCYATVGSTIDEGTSLAAASTQSPPTSLSLDSAAGEVIVTLRQAVGGAAAVPASAALPTVDNAGAEATPPVQITYANVYSPPSKRSGLRLAHADAQRLMSTYGKAAGDQGSTERLYLVIDVERGVGTLPVRWIYVSHSAYLVLDPAALGYLSLGVLRPPMAYERVRFFNNDCVLDEPLTDARRNATLAAMHTQLFRALHSSAWDKSRLRGVLVVQTDAYAPLTGGLEVEYFGTDINPEPSSRKRWSNLDLESVLRCSVGMSVFVGMTIGLILLAVLVGALSRRHASWLRARRSTRKLVLKNHYQGLSHEQLNARVNADTAGDARDDTFTLLLRCIADYTTSALASWSVSSLDLFLAERTEVEEDVTSATALVQGQIRAAAKRVSTLVDHAQRMVGIRARAMTEAGMTDPRHASHFVYMRRLFRQYELYCLDHELPIEQSRAKIQRELVQRHNVRVSQILVQRLRGVRWKPSVLSTFRSDAARAQKLTAAASREQSGERLRDKASFGGGLRPASWQRTGGWLREFLHQHCEGVCSLSPASRLKSASCFPWQACCGCRSARLLALATALCCSRCRSDAPHQRLYRLPVARE